MKNLPRLIKEACLYRSVAPDSLPPSLPVVIYCNTLEAPAALADFKRKYKRSADYICLNDSNQTLPSTSKLLPQQQLPSLLKHIQCLVWCYGKKERAKGLKLASAGIRNFSFATAPLYSSHRHDPCYWDNYSRELSQVFELLADDESRQTFASTIKMRITGDHGFLRTATYREYFHPLVKVTPGDWVIDAGASNGATSLAFANASKTGKVFAFEPDPTNREKISALLEAETSAGNAVANNIEIAAFALSDTESQLAFTAGKGGSSSINRAGSISASGTITVNATSLDLFVQQNNIERIDLISIDIEGAEALALKGMRETIQRFRPKLQVSIYHKKKDLFELPLMVADLVQDYVFFFGHHNTYSTETDLYAIPKEKLPAWRPKALYSPQRRLFVTPISPSAKKYLKQTRNRGLLGFFARSINKLS